jgi:GTP-binding protein
MNVHTAELMISAAEAKQYPEGEVPEVALAGRSNVGKSSLINCIISRKALARTSSRPGKTQLLNFYQVSGKTEDGSFDGEYRIVDVPGYGFANVSKSIQAKWGAMMEQYFTTREPLLGVILIVDLRHEPSKDDVLMWNWLRHYGIRVAVIATKADKLTKNQIPRQMALIRRTLEGIDDSPFICFSSETGRGRDEVWAILHQWAKQKPTPRFESFEDIE